jgi:hypothetical protein
VLKMNDFDKKLYSGLNYFANNDLVEINKLRKQYVKKYHLVIAKEIEIFMFEQKYLDVDDRKKYAITAKGLAELRTLEENRINERSSWISIIALILSIVSILLSVGVI